VSTLLEVSGISVTFDGFRAINNLSFNIGAAELRAIIGPNGAGKTTFMDIVTGKTRPDEGQVLWGETSRSLLQLSESQIAQAGIGRKFQRPTVFEDQSVEDEPACWPLRRDRSPFKVLAFKKTVSPMRRPSARLAAEIGLLLIRFRGKLASSHTGKSSGSRLACCSHRTRNCFWWTSLPPA
jgi:urea transport system ATP-binding protein